MEATIAQTHMFFTADDRTHTDEVAIAVMCRVNKLQQCARQHKRNKHLLEPSCVGDEQKNIELRNIFKKY